MTIPNTRGSGRHLVKGHPAGSKHPAIHSPSTLGFLAWANASLPKLSFADGEQNLKLIPPKNCLQLASALSAVLIKMQKQTHLRQLPSTAPGTTLLLINLSKLSLCTSLASSSYLKARLKKPINFRNKRQWEKGAFCLKNSFLARLPLKTTVNNKYNFTFKSQDGILPLLWKYSQVCACWKENKNLWSLVITATLLCSLSKRAQKLSMSSVDPSAKAAGLWAI